MADPAAPVLLISPMDAEIEALSAQLTALEPRPSLGPVPCWQARSPGGQPVVLAQCGIGKVNAAMAATLLLSALAPRLVLVVGVAGGLDPDLAVGDVVLSTELRQSDYGALVDGTIRAYRPGVPPLPGFEDQPLGFVPPAAVLTALGRVTGESLVPVPGTLSAPGRIVTGTILSGDVFLDCRTTREHLAATHAAKAFEMEGAAIAQVAAQLGAVPCVSVRCLSDLAGGREGGGDQLSFATFLPAAAARAARASLRVIAALS